jgi:hypothetical protein
MYYVSEVHQFWRIPAELLYAEMLTDRCIMYNVTHTDIFKGL